MVVNIDKERYYGIMNCPDMTIFAPAKVNLHLKVLDKREDSFHNLESLFIRINFGDTLHLEPVTGKNSAEITMKWENIVPEMIPLEKNIIYKAVSLFREKTGFEQGFNISVTKRIPAGGGLGGGSSNAAAVLLALNGLAEKSGQALEKEELLSFAKQLGSDVPFFLLETKAAYVTGRGEHITPLEMPAWCFVLVNPGFKSDTAAAFRLLDNYRKTNKTPLCPFVSSVVNFDFSYLYNDFLPVFNEPEKSVYKKIISQLLKLGAEYANLSGSGSTCFGVFKEKAAAEKAAAFLENEWSFVKAVSAAGTFPAAA